MAPDLGGPAGEGSVEQPSGSAAVVDPATEAKAVMNVVQALEGLDAAAVTRVLDWAVKRYAAATLAKVPPRSQTTAVPFRPPGDVSDAHRDDLAALYEAVNPATEWESVLVAAYWHQSVQGADHLDSQSLNTGLKNLGHGVGNVTRACSALIRQKPSLMMQVRKAGSTKQARKQYRLTSAGVQRIREMLATGATREGAG